MRPHGALLPSRLGFVLPREGCDLRAGGPASRFSFFAKLGRGTAMEIMPLTFLFLLFFIRAAAVVRAFLEERLYAISDRLAVAVRVLSSLRD